MSARAAAAALSLLLAPIAASAAVVITGPLTRELVVEPGRSYEGSIDVANPGKASQDVKAYQTDYFFYASGEVLYGKPGELPRSNARWVTFTPRQATVPPGETITIRFSVQVPADDSLKGTYWSVLMVEPVAPGSPESRQPNAQTGMGVTEVLRYAVQIVTHIGDTGSRHLAFSHIRLAAENGKKVLAVDVENTGGRWLRGSLWTELYDQGGASAGKFEAGRQRMYPGTSVRFRVDLVGVPKGTYKALIVVDCGGEDVFGANVNLILKD